MLFTSIWCFLVLCLCLWHSNHRSAALERVCRILTSVPFAVFLYLVLATISAGAAISWTTAFVASVVTSRIASIIACVFVIFGLLLCAICLRILSWLFSWILLPIPCNVTCLVWSKQCLELWLCIYCTLEYNWQCSRNITLYTEYLPLLRM